MTIKLSDHFTYHKLIKFVVPSIIMMMFTSIYCVVDGLFVSNFAGTTAFAAVNLIMPVLMILSSIGFMIGTGGSAIIAKTLGEGNREKANEYFSMLVYVTIIGGIVLAALGVWMIPVISRRLGAQDVMLENCIVYGRIILTVLPAFMLQNVFQSFLVTAEKPHLGLMITLAAGVTNAVLDYLFIVVLGWGIAGAALATATSQVVGGIVPLIYFMRKNKSLLKLVKTKLHGSILLKTCINGSSELMTNISISLVSVLYNYQLMRMVGENGIAVYGVIMYVAYMFIAIFIGYAIGSGPIIGYNYGANNVVELKNVFRKSMIINGVLGTIITIVSFILAKPLAKVFVGYDPDLFAMATHAFKIYSLCFIAAGLNIFCSAFFTALNNGVVSALISFLRTLVFQVGVVLILPIFLGLEGIWLAVVVAEALALIITIIILIIKNKEYHYI